MATQQDRPVVSFEAAFRFARPPALDLFAPRLRNRYPVRFLLTPVRMMLLLPAALSVTSGRFERRATHSMTLAELSSRLRRDLHDCFSPSVTAAAMRIQTARRLFAEDPGAADALLAQAQDELNDAISQMEEILNASTPHGELRDQALDKALIDLAARFKQASGGQLGIIVNCPSLPGLMPNIKHAAYYIVSEAVTNVARHSRATKCLIRINRSARGIRVNVLDNGIGLPAEPGAGIGLLSMRDRAIGLGGDFSIRRLPSGGTQIVAHIPFSCTETRDQVAADDIHERSLR